MPPEAPEPQDTPPPGRGHLRDIVYGAIDGSVTTFAIVAGVAGAGLSPFVILALGMANVLADGFSMAAGNYAGTKAELDDAARLRAEQSRRLTADPAGARVALRRVLAQRGLSGGVLQGATDQIAANPKAAVDTLIEGEFGLASVDPHPMRAALMTFGAFLAAGLIPLAPFVLGLEEAFTISAVLTLITFFAIGAFKSIWSLSPWWRSGLETLAVGGAAASIAYFVGTLFNL